MYSQGCGGSSPFFGTNNKTFSNYRYVFSCPYVLHHQQRLVIAAFDASAELLHVFAAGFHQTLRATNAFLFKQRS